MFHKCNTLYESNLIIKILSSVLSKDQKFNDIQRNTGISPRILRKYLDHMKRIGLLKEKTKNWTAGKSKPCSITEKGLKWFIDTSLLDFLKLFSSVLESVKKTENRDAYQKTRQKKYSQTIDLFRNYLIEGYEKGLNPFEELKKLSESEYNKKFRINDLDQILRDALRKLSILIMFYWSNKSWEEIERLTNTHYHVFGPRMEHWFSYRAGTNANIDSHFLQIWNEFNRINSEQENLEIGDQNNEKK